MTAEKQIPTDAEQFYQEIVLPAGLFEQVYEHYPHYNGWQCCQAADWIVCQLDDKYKNDPVWEAIRDDVYDKIVAGLT